MIKLSKGQIEKLLPRYTGQTPLELQFALELQYAYHGENGFGPYKCPVFADDAENPNILLLGTDWVHLWGDASYGKSDDALFEWIAKQRARLPAKKDMVLNLYSLGWETKLENRFSDLVKERGFRLNHRLNREAFAQHAGWRERIPAGFEVRYFALKRNRFAFRVMKGEECVSACTVVYFEKEAYDSETARVVEIDILTKEMYRRHGFAFFACAAFIEHCLAHDLEPNWGCWDTILGSRGLAKKLGFEEISRRPELILEKKKKLFARRGSL